ncbi:MAG: CDP-alcohol phosphatidyltransferase family protein [Bacteroides sp.]|nr:CDP-alcohol phosphatidyltransferase family protein [Bacteroides sp.]
MFAKLTTRQTTAMAEKIYNIPNLLSFYRILVFPYILYLAITEQENLFAIFLVINLLTDILDGFIARRFNMQTEFGARLDSAADIGTYILAIAGIFIFKAEDFRPHLISFYIFIFLLLAAYILSLIRFGRFPSLHLYSWKIGGYIQGGFFCVLFLFGFNTVFYYFMIIWGILAFCEHMVIQFLLTDMQSNAKGLYWVLKNRQTLKQQ